MSISWYALSKTEVESIIDLQVISGMSGINLVTPPNNFSCLPKQYQLST